VEHEKLMRSLKKTRVNLAALLLFPKLAEVDETR
jgi:poly(A) polymerase Pap1